MRGSVSRMAMAATLAAAGLAACSDLTDVTPWAYPTEPETAQRAAPVRAEPELAPPSYTAPRVIAAAPAPVAPPPPTVTYAPPRAVDTAPVVTAPPVVAAAPAPVAPPPPAVTYAPPRAVAPPAPVAARPALTFPPEPGETIAPRRTVTARPRPVQPAPVAPARAAPVVIAQAPVVVAQAPAATTVYVPARPMLTEKSGLIDFVLTDGAGRPDGAILKDKTVIRFSPSLAAAMDPDRSRLAPGRPIVVRGSVTGGRRAPALEAVEMGSDIYSMVTLGY